MHCIPLDPSETRAAEYARVGFAWGRLESVTHNRLNNLMRWIGSSEKDTAKAFRTDIYGSALLDAD